MSLMTIRLELGRTADAPQGDANHGYEFVAPLNSDGHLDIAEWAAKKDRCGVRSFRPGHVERKGMLRHVGRGWRFDYLPGRTDDDEPFFKLDRHIIAPGLYVTITEEDGIERPFRIAAVKPVRAAA
jgi:hypothetical protein